MSAECGITELTIPEGITTIYSGAFQRNKSLTVVRLPSTIKSIDSSAFADCDKLTDVYYTGTNTEAIWIGPNNSLTSTTWYFVPAPEPDPRILTLPNMLLTISAEAFANTEAQKIIIPESVDVIESQAFANCESLEVLYFEGSPFSIDNSILGGRTDVTIDCLPGSSAAKWANRLSLPVVYH